MKTKEEIKWLEDLMAYCKTVSRADFCKMPRDRIIRSIEQHIQKLKKSNKK